MQVSRFIVVNSQSIYKDKEHTIKALANLVKDTVSIEGEIAWDTPSPTAHLQAHLRKQTAQFRLAPQGGNRRRCEKKKLYECYQSTLK